MKTILSLCDRSGNWPFFYKAAGYKVICFDLPNDIRLIKKLDDDVHGILSAPPCTCFARSGAWVKRSKEDMIEAMSVVDACLRAVMVYRPKFWALENPIGMLRQYIGQPKMYFQPYEYGDPYTKKTCLWGEFNPPTKKVVSPVGKSPVMMLGGKSERTKYLRSLTPLGFAEAFFNANP